MLPSVLVGVRGFMFRAGELAEYVEQGEGVSICQSCASDPSRVSERVSVFDVHKPGKWVLVCDLCSDGMLLET